MPSVTSTIGSQPKSEDLHTQFDGWLVRDRSSNYYVAVCGIVKANGEIYLAGPFNLNPEGATEVYLKSSRPSLQMDHLWFVKLDLAEKINFISLLPFALDQSNFSYPLI